MKNNPSNKNILLDNWMLIIDCSVKFKNDPKNIEIIKNDTKNGNLMLFESFVLNL